MSSNMLPPPPTYESVMDAYIRPIYPRLVQTDMHRPTLHRCASCGSQHKKCQGGPPDYEAVSSMPIIERGGPNDHDYSSLNQANPHNRCIWCDSIHVNCPGGPPSYDFVLCQPQPRFHIRTSAIQDSLRIGSEPAAPFSGARVLLPPIGTGRPNRLPVTPNDPCTVRRRMELLERHRRLPSP